MERRVSAVEEDRRHRRAPASYGHADAMTASGKPQFSPSPKMVSLSEF